jgi:hypothetical protein
MKLHHCLSILLVVTLVPAALGLEDVAPLGANQSSYNASFLPSFELSAGSYSGDDVIIVKEGTNVSLECLLTVDQYGEVHWYNSKGQQLHSRGNPVRCDQQVTQPCSWGL